MTASGKRRAKGEGGVFRRADGRGVAELDLGWVEGSAGVGGSTDGRGGRLWTS
jgi:hypothetical protein